MKTGFQKYPNNINKNGRPKIKKKVEVIKCACGCNEDLNKYDNRNRVRRFIKGHSQRVGFGRKGRVHTELTRKKISATKQGCVIEEWRGFVGDDNYNQRRLFRNMLQKKIFERDNYTCQMCGQYGGDLQVDHIQSWADFIDRRFDIDNCRTLCTQCHYLITFGKPMPCSVTAWGHNLMKGGEGI